MTDTLLELLTHECNFVWENVDSFESTFCSNLELISVSFNDLTLYVAIADPNSGKLFSNPYKISEYLDWKNKILEVKNHK